MPADESFELRVRERLVAKLHAVADHLDALEDVSALEVARVLGEDAPSHAIDQVAGDRDAVRDLAASYRNVARALDGDGA